MNHCYLFIGPSGSGKTSLAEKAFAPEQKIVSYTTRAPRKDEIHGRDYYFVSKKEFKQMVNHDQFAEYDVYDEHFYGIAKETLREALAAGDCYDPITTTGFINLQRLFGDQMVPIWISISKETMIGRLEKRASAEDLKRRLAIFQEDQESFVRLKKYSNLIEIDGEASLDEMLLQLRKALK
ncbi:guanylate kinase [Candidatus Enterococcus murrayae]|uniref:Guanylate kinase n=1 Tax=Candidatus Enterococcus murrayae TaxID=2815321 RepID=A0ABS3HLI4_9ENTE|nr:guanylate kinase [Enterococcus sp. MJM16]MBO0453872.1 guanylate kinase [Enterococcus sp. MJM16]